MWSEKFSRIIDHAPIRVCVEDKGRVLRDMDPQRIYVENVRSFFHIPFGAARWICNRAVGAGLFSKHIAYLCPECEHVIAETEFNQPLNPNAVVACTLCELKEQDPEKLISACRKLEFYKVISDE